MCIAIYKPENKQISKEILKTCFDNNNDGAGFMFASRRHRLNIRKGFFKFEDFWKAYEPLQNKQMAIHFRIKTHGPIDKDNCHPFMVSEELGFIHNGIISSFSSDHSKSDTSEFNANILKPFVNRWGPLALFEDPMQTLIEDFIGYSKLVFLDNKGNYNIYNEDKGVWDDGVWYSNTSYKPYVPKQYAPPPTKHLSSVPSSYNSGYQKRAFKTIEQKKTEIKIGYTVEFTSVHYDVANKKSYKAGTVWEVIAVNKNYTVDLISNEDVTDFDIIYNVPLWRLDLVEDTYVNAYSDQNDFSKIDPYYWGD